MADRIAPSKARPDEAPSLEVANEFRIAAPANWFRLDLDPRTYRANIRKMIDQRLGSGPDYEDSRRELFELLERFTSAAIAQGAVQAFLLSDRIGDRPMAASLVCTVTATPGMPVLDDVAAGLRAAARRGAYSEVKIVELPAGLCVRTLSRRKADLPDTSAPTVEVETVQHFFVVPGRDALLLLSFSTPDLALSDAFGELFDAMAASLTWGS